jgi:hypothetical protein
MGILIKQFLLKLAKEIWVVLKGIRAKKFIELKKRTLNQDIGKSLFYMGLLRV